MTKYIYNIRKDAINGTLSKMNNKGKFWADERLEDKRMEILSIRQEIRIIKKRLKNEKQDKRLLVQYLILKERIFKLSSEIRTGY